MINFLRKIFITEPMKWNYILSLLLSIIVCAILFYNTNDENLIKFEIFFVILIIIFFIKNLGDLKQNLGPLSKQKESAYNVSITKGISILFWMILYIFFYIPIYLVLEYIIVKTCNSILANSLNVALFSLIVYLICSRLVYDILKVSPMRIFLTVFIPILLSSMIGIEKSILNWTFIALVIGTVVIQLVNVDIKYFLPTELKNVMEKGNDENERIYKLKYYILLYLPVLYLSLYLSEWLTTSKNFIYLICLISFPHMNYFAVVESFSYYFIAAILRIVIVLVFWIIFNEYKDKCLEIIALFLLKPLKSNVVIKSGNYYEVKYKKQTKEWVKSNNSYIAVYKNIFCKKDLNKKGNTVYEIIKNDTSGKININQVSENIVRIDEDYFILENTVTMNDILKSDKYNGNKILKKTNYSILLLPFILTILIFIIGFSLNCKMTNNEVDNIFKGIKSQSSNNINVILFENE